ncbi:hypothetical protein COCON_G00231100 [Conger conger]|uniref:PWWP domain-containing protein n=1 Tax=Conger conger TaxID=82655 RepID=A0A9Q1CVJ2_CONCO|nr:hypothetical protein COCON_G00231100 [Conger conger]
MAVESGRAPCTGPWLVCVPGQANRTREAALLPVWNPPRPKRRLEPPALGRGGSNALLSRSPGLSNGFVIAQEAELGPGRPLEPRRRCASESSISSSGSLLCSPSRVSLPKCGKGRSAAARRKTTDDRSELTACRETGSLSQTARRAAEVGSNNMWMSTSATTVALEPLKLVWAKCSGYPSYPALIIDPKMPRAGCHRSGAVTPTAPPSVLRAGERMQYKSAEKLFLVLFFDNKRSWQWLPKSKMAPLGLDKAVDEVKMAEGRTSGVRKAVQTAFDRATAYLARVRDRLTDLD